MASPNYNESVKVIIEVADKGAVEAVGALKKKVGEIKLTARETQTQIKLLGEELLKVSKQLQISAKVLGNTLSSEVTKEMKYVTQEATKYAQVLERIEKVATFTQAKARVSGAFTESDFFSNIGEKAKAEKSRILSSSMDERFARAQQRVRGLWQEEEYLSNIAQKARVEQDRFNQKVEQTEHPAKRAAKSLQQFWNTVKGTLTAMLVFYTTQPIIDFFTRAIELATKFRGAMAQLDFSEMILSKKGIDVSRQDFDDLINHIQNKFKYLSESEATKIVSDTLGMLDEFDVPYEDMGKMAEGLAFVNLQMKLLGEEAVDSGSVLNALMDARSNFFNRLGINITEQLILEKAYEMGLAKQGEEVSKNARQQAARALFIEQTAGKTDELIAAIEELNPKLAKQMEFQRIVDDTALSMGNSILKVRDAFIELGLAIDDGGDGRQAFNTWFDEITTGITEFIDSVTIAIDAIKNIKANLSDLTGIDFGILEAIRRGLQSAINIIATFIATAFSLIISGFAVRLKGGSIIEAYRVAGGAAAEAWITGWKKTKAILGGDAELFGTPSPRTGGLPPDERGLDRTPTGPGRVDGAIEEEQSDLQKALDEMNREILESQIKLAQDMEEAQIDLGRKLVDIAEEYANKRADAERDYASKITDINSSYREKLSDIRNDEVEENAKARNDELEREAEFQNKMLELKEKYLMDLEEALHERDARQVLRLMKQYNLDKAQAERENALDRQSAARDLQEKKRQFARERADAENERKTKLAQAARDYQDKLAQLKADEEAERRAAQIAYERKMQDLNREMHNRLSLVAAGLVQEFKLTKSGLDAIYALYKMYFGAITGVYSAMNTMLAGQSMTLAMNQLYTTNPSSSGGGRSTTTKAFAEGGMMIADRPTTVTFGEGGTPELAQFTPIGKNGRDVNKLFSNLGSAGSSSGSGALEIDLTLSPDLEARVIKKSADNVANVITRVQRSKVR